MYACMHRHTVEDPHVYVYLCEGNSFDIQLNACLHLCIKHIHSYEYTYIHVQHRFLYYAGICASEINIFLHKLTNLCLRDLNI